MLDKKTRWPGLVEFSTDAIPACERFDHWFEQYRSVHSVEVARDLRSSFAAKFSSWRLGPILIAEFSTPARRIVRDPRQARRDDLDHVVLRVAMEGPTLCGAGDARIVVPPGEVVIGTYAKGYADDLPSGRWVTAILDRSAFPEFWGWSGVPQRLQGTSAAMLSSFLDCLPVALRRIRVGEEAGVTHTVRSVLSACLAGCMNLSPPAADDGQSILRLQVDRIIADKLSSPRLTPARIAELAGVSRSQLYRAFETEGGIAQRVLHRRLTLVRRDLESPALDRLSAAQIAERRGLHNAAAFHRAFRQHFGDTPGSYRADARECLKSASRDSRQAIAKATPQFIDMLRSPVS